MVFFHPVLPTQIFANSRYPDGYLWRPVSHAYFQSQILPSVCSRLSDKANLRWQSRKSRRLSLASRIPCLLSSPVCLIIPNPWALIICTEISVKSFRQMVLVFLLAPKTRTGLSSTIYKMPVKFSLSLHIKPGTGNRNKWYRKFR